MSGSCHHHSSSPDESYRPLPQSDDDASELPVPTQADIGLDDEGSEESFSDDPIDPRIKWIYFVFGCAMLLPWNCELSRLSVHSSTDYSASLDHGDPIFPITIKRVPIPVHVRIVSIVLLHCCQFSVLDILHRYIYTGTSHNKAYRVCLNRC